jgi:hypothetical protein
MTESDNQDGRANILGQLDPIVRGFVSGWAMPGAVVALTIDGQRIGTMVASERRLFVLGGLADSNCGFEFTPPAELFDGGEHEIRATVDDVDLPGSPLSFQADRVSWGEVEGLAGNVLHGRLRQSAPLPISVAAMVGDEVVAVAPAKPASSGEAEMLTFLLPLPLDLIGGPRSVVHVGVVGTNVMLSGSPYPLLKGKPRTTVLRAPQPPVTLAIKIAAPVNEAPRWGDFHFAKSLAAAFQRRGWHVRIDCREEWDRKLADVALVLRGRVRHSVDPSAINLMWIISHPDRIEDNELADYDHVFVASEVYTSTLKALTDVPVSLLHQATDTTLFHKPEQKISIAAPLLFIGNSRKEYRTMVRWCFEKHLPIALFGTLWKGIVPDHLITGEYISNAVVHQWYGSCKILLNDHWDSMRENGFLSNRLFDGSAAGAFIITDPVRGLSSVFGDAIETVESADELEEKVSFYLNNEPARHRKIEEAREIVLSGHTFDHRAEQIIETYGALAEARATGSQGASSMVA